MASPYPPGPPGPQGPMGPPPGPPQGPINTPYPPGQYRYPPWRHYPMLDLVTFIIRMVGVLIVFVGVIGIGSWVSDLGNEDTWSDSKDIFEDLGGNIFIIGAGGIVIAVSYLMLGISKFAKGKYDTT